MNSQPLDGTCMTSRSAAPHVIVGGGFPESRCAGNLGVVIEYLPAFDIYHHRLVLKSGTSYRLVT